MADDRSEAWVSSGVGGLDDVLLGGYLRGGFYLIQGEPGSGKTTLASSTASPVFAQAKVGSTFRSPNPVATCAHVRCPRLVARGARAPRPPRSGENTEVESQLSVFDPADTELSDLTRFLRDEVTRLAPAHVIFDGLSELCLGRDRPALPPHPARAQGFFRASRRHRAPARRPQLELQRGARREPGRRQHRARAPLAGLRPGASPLARSPRCAVRPSGRATTTTRSSGAALEVFPRLVASEHHDTHLSEPCPSGIDNLDRMLCGGLTAGSTTVMLGPAGAGKSTITMQFVVDALSRGKKAAVYIFDEIMRDH